MTAPGAVWSYDVVRARYPRAPYYGLTIRHKVAVISQTPLLELLGDQGLVVDVGCGFGAISLLVAAARPGLTVLGVEPDEKRVRRAVEAARGLDNVSIRQGDARTYAWPPCRGVVFFDVLHHMLPAEQDAVIGAVGRALEPGGTLVIYEMDTRYRPRWKYWLSHFLDFVLYPNSVQGQFRPESEFRAAAAAAGLRPEADVHIASHINAPVMYVYRKPPR